MNTLEPLVTVAIPVLDGERYLDRAIRSVLAQTYRHLELVVVDNASTDGTRRIAEDAARDDDRVSYVRQPSNVGAVANFNEGLARAAGEFFCWLAHDDWIAPSYVATCLEQLTRPDVVLCSSMMGVVDESGRVFRVQRERLAGGDVPEPVRRLHSMVWTLQDPTAPVFGLARTAALRSAGGIPAAPEPDRLLLYALSLLGRVRTVDDVLFFHFGPPGHVRHYGTGRLHRRSWDWLHAPGQRKVKLSAVRVLVHQVRVIGAADLGPGERVVAVVDACVASLVRRGASKARKVASQHRRRPVRA